MHIIVLVLALVVASPVLAAENHVSAVPYGTDLAHYPVVALKEVPKTAKQEYELETKLELRPAELRIPLMAFNHYRKDNSWRYEKISEGAIVFVDVNGVIRYKADCWNRLVVVEHSWLDDFLAWLGGIGSHVWGVAAGLTTLLAFIAGLILGVLWGRARTSAQPPHPAAPAPVLA